MRVILQEDVEKLGTRVLFDCTIIPLCLHNESSVFRQPGNPHQFTMDAHAAPRDNRPMFMLDMALLLEG